MLARTLTRSWLAVMFLCIAIAAGADFLLYGHPLGCNAAILCAGLLVVICLHAPALRRRRAAIAALLLTLGITGALLLEPTAIALLMAAVLIAATAMLARGSWTWHVSDWSRRFARLALRTVLQPLLDTLLAARRWARHPALPGRPALRAAASLALWLVAFALGLLFLGLFTLANPMIEQWLRSTVTWLWTALAWLPDFLAPARIAFWLLVALATYALLRYRQSHRDRGARLPAVAAPPVLPLSAALTIRALLVCNAVFLLQTILDITYLWLGAALPPGMTYAQYAHRGAYPLLASALLAAAIVLIAFRRGGPAERSRPARTLVFLWIAQNLLLLASTIARLWLYIDAYSLTEWRLATVIWVALVAAGFAWIVAKILARRSNAWLLRANIATLFVVLYAAAFCNFAGWIADFNVAHCREVTGAGPPLDIAYLRDLGPAALPALARAPQSREVLAARRTLLNRFNTQSADWRGWTYRRALIGMSLFHPFAYDPVDDLEARN